MRRQKRLTKKDRKGPAGHAATAARPAIAAPSHGHPQAHIHCIACGKHLDPDMFGEPDGADFLRCEHGSDFAHCVGCIDKARALVGEHDRTGKRVNAAAQWH